MITIASLILMAGTNNSRATIHNVEVEDFEFNPTTFIANVGDTIHWFWDEGFHTTTSFIIPASAPSWDQPLSAASPTFDYIITVPGSYDYICSPHASMGMTGHFTVLGSTAIQENSAPSLSIIKNYVYDNQLQFDYTMPATASISIQLFDALGQELHVEKINNQIAGIHSHSIGVARLPKGIYILSLFTQLSRLTHKIVIE